MRFVCTADLHIGEEIPGLDRFKILHQIFNYAKRKEAQFLIVAGDIYEHLMISNSLRAKFNQLIKEYTNYFEVVLFPGNHDVGVRTTTLAPLVPFRDKRLRVVMEPSRFTRDGKRFLILPFKLQMEQDNKYIKQICKEFQGSYECVFAHLLINGATVGASNFALLSGINREGFNKYFEAKYFILGHLHKPQNLDNFYYCGSPDYLDFGEREDEKRFLYYNNGKLHSIPIENKSLVQIIVNKEGVKGHLIPNAIYKIVVNCRKKDIKDIPIKEVIEKIKKKGSVVNKVTWKIKSKGRRQDETINNNGSLKGNLKRYINRFAKEKNRQEITDITKEILYEADKNRNK